MTSFLDRFKGKASQVSKDGILSSLDKTSVPISKILSIKQTKPQSFPVAKQVKSALLPSKQQGIPQKVIPRERKINSFSTKPTKSNTETPEGLFKNVRSLVIKTENDLPEKGFSIKQKSAPVSIRNSPALAKKKTKNGISEDQISIKSPFPVKNIAHMELIDEGAEFEEAQRLHLEFLNRVEKLNSFK